MIVFHCNSSFISDLFETWIFSALVMYRMLNYGTSTWRDAVRALEWCVTVTISNHCKTQQMFNKNIHDTVLTDCVYRLKVEWENVRAHELCCRRSSCCIFVSSGQIVANNSDLYTAKTISRFEFNLGFSWKGFTNFCLSSLISSFLGVTKVRRRTCFCVMLFWSIRKSVLNLFL